MKFVCERCHTKYSIADEKVRGKVLKVRCKTCENVITVREHGVTIDDPHSAVPKDAPQSRSGTLDGATVHGSVSAVSISPHSARRTTGAAAPVGLAAAAAVRPSMPEDAFLDPLAPAVAPPPRRRAPTPGPAAALATIVDDGLDWYLAVDGAQTGPFNRPTLIQKILLVPAGGDIHVWNAGLGSWKPPKEVPDILADLVRVKRASQPAAVPPALPRRPTGALPTVAAHGAAGDASAHHTGANGVSALAGHGAESGHGHAHGHPHAPPAPGEHKANGIGAAPAGVAGPGAVSAKGHGGVLAVEDLFSESGVTALAPAAAAGAAAAAPLGALPSATMTSSAAVGAARGGLAGMLAGRPNRQVKLMIGAAALVVIVCGIVAVAALRKPASSGAVAAPEVKVDKLAATEPAPAPPTAAAAPPASAPAPAATETPSIAKVDSHADPRADHGVKGSRVKGRRKGEGGLSPTTPPPISGGGMTAEQMQAASRFGDSTTRDVRAASASGGGARSTPAQADISRVITNNRQGIQTCYQRALLRDSTLTQGRVTVRVWIGLSGKVKSVSLDAPPQFRTMESCVRDVMSRWAFPPSSEEYGTEFPFLLQGNQ